MKRSLVGAALVLALDVGMDGSCLFAWISCPIWFLVSFLTTAIDRRTGWGLALARVGVPALTLGIAWVNMDIQLGVAEANARRVIGACEAYQKDHGAFPGKLAELVPGYLDRVPPAKHCLGPAGQFSYFNSGTPMLVYPIAGFLRKIYSFDTRRWSYLD